MTEPSDGRDLLTSEPPRRRGLLVLGVVTTVAIVLTVARHGSPARTVVRPSPTVGAVRPSLDPLPPVTIRSAGAVQLLSPTRATLRVAVANPNARPVTLLRVGQGISGISLHAVEPTPVRLAPHGNAVVVVTFDRAADLPCDSAGGAPIAVAVAVGASGSAISWWRLPLRVAGRPWDAALAAALCSER